MKTIWSERHNLSSAIDTCELLACGLTSFEPHRPSGRGKVGNPLVLYALWAADVIDRDADGYYIVRADTVDKATKASKVLFAKFMRSEASRPTITAAAVIKAFGAQPILRQS